jgi:gliding motility-associated-like protein
MTKTFQHISIIFIVFFISFSLTKTLNAQCKVKIVVPSQQMCLGDTISMYALGGCGSVLVEHFNDSTLGNQLSSNNPLPIARLCDDEIDGSIYPWFGTLSAGPHQLTTNSLNLNTAGFQICFDMRYGEEGTGGNCEGPSTLAEAVHLQYSTNAGSSWTDIQVWDPNGGHDANLIQWKHYCINLPAAAQSPNTLIRWAQNSSSAINTANWGIDNINIIKVVGTIYNWSTGYSGIQHPDITPSNATFYSVNASGTNGCICSDSITIHPAPKPSGNYVFTGSLCKNENITFNYSGNAPPSASYKWNFGTASQVNGGGQGPIVVQWSKTGSYYPTLVVTNNGCSSDPYKTEVSITPLISFFMDKSSGCEDLTINFKGNAFPKNSDYFWDFGDGGNSTDSTPSYTYVDAGDYDLSIIIKSSSGCYDTLILANFIHCFPSPNVDFDFSPPIIPFSDPEASFNNKTQNGQTYLWDFGDGGSSKQTNPNHTYSSLGDYIVWLKAESDKGCTDSISKLLKVVEDRFSTPNVITPNGDGVNDVFKVENLESLQSCELEVYNRWGQLVFSDAEYDNLWNGDELADGVYFYIVKYISFFGEGEFTGTLTIMRK